MCFETKRTPTGLGLLSDNADGGKGDDDDDNDDDDDVICFY